MSSASISASIEANGAGFQPTVARRGGEIEHAPPFDVDEADAARRRRRR